MVRQELAPGLVAGYDRLTSECIESVAKHSSRAAAVSIVDATSPIHPSVATLKAITIRPDTPASSVYRGTPAPSINSGSSGSPIIVYTPTSSSSPANTATTTSSAGSATPDEPILNFLRIDFKPDNTGLHLNLLLRLEGICEFIDNYHGTFPDERDALAEQVAAIQFDPSDDDIYCGQSVLAMTNDNPVLPVGQLGRIVLIHGGETKAARFQPAFVGIAYLMRKWGKSFKDTYKQVTIYNARKGGARIELTGNQHQQLLLWEVTRYRIMERGTLGGRFYKQEYTAYRRSASRGN